MLLDISLHLHLGPASNAGDASVAKTRVAEVMLVATSFLGFVYSLYVCIRVWHIEKRDAGVPYTRFALVSCAMLFWTDASGDRWREHIICSLGQQRTPATRGDKVCCRCTSLLQSA
jgi:hypothetical protein